MPESEPKPKLIELVAPGAGQGWKAVLKNGKAAVVHEIPDKRAHLSPAVNVVLRHVRCPTLQKWPNRPTKIDRSRSIRVGGYGPLLH